MELSNFQLSIIGGLALWIVLVIAVCLVCGINTLGDRDSQS
jgi:hypothetical protein